MAHYIFNVPAGDASRITRRLRADFEVGVVQITAVEYETALAVAGERATSTA